jgi:hypothetical protein
MRHPKLRHIAAAGALALSATIPLAACGAPSASPRPVQAAESSAAVSQTPATTSGAASPAGTAQPGTARPPNTPKPAKTTRPASPRPIATTPTGTCYGAIRHDLDLHNTVLDLQKSMCFHTGGVLRLQGIGPGLVTATPGALVSPSYEAGVQDLRFLRPGTVTVTIPLDEQTYTITVVVRS